MTRIQDVLTPNSFFGNFSMPLRKDMQLLVTQTLHSWIVRFIALQMVFLNQTGLSAVLSKRAQMDKGLRVGRWGQLQGRLFQPSYYTG